MKSRILSCITAMTLFAVLAIPVRLATQEQAQEEHHAKHHRYKLVDIGTFGGPESYINNAMSLGAPNQINRRGTVVGSSATSIPSPPDSNFSICGGLDGSVHFVFHAFKWQNGVVTDLGALPGDDNCSVATSINARGEIVGHSENGVFDPVVGIRETRAVLWKDGKIKDLGTFGGHYSLAGSINDRGQIAGVTTNAIPDPFSFFYLPASNGTQTRAFLWENGHKHDLHTLGGPDAQAFFVNNHGQVIGISYTNDIPNPSTGLPTQDPFLWTKEDGMIDLGSFGGTQGGPNGLNNRGQVIGDSKLAGDTISHPFLWDDGKLIDLFTDTTGGKPVTANAINDAGEIVGRECVPNKPCGIGMFHGPGSAYLWRNGVAIDLGTLPGDCSSEAYAINSRGQVVGQSVACDGSTRSFLWENGSMIDLNSFVPPGSGLQLVEAVAINDCGQIAGDEVPPDCGGGIVPSQGNDAKCGHAYVLIPCDDDHADEEGCADEGGSTAAETQNHATPGTQTSTNVNHGSLTPEGLATLRARLARRHHIPGLGAPRF